MTLYDQWETLSYKANRELERAQVAARASTENAHIAANAARERANIAAHAATDAAYIRANAQHESDRRKEAADAQREMYRADVNYNLQAAEHRVRKELEQLQQQGARNLAHDRYTHDWYLQKQKGEIDERLEGTKHTNQLEIKAAEAKTAVMIEELCGKNARDLANLNYYHEIDLNNQKFQQQRILEQDKRLIELERMDNQLHHNALMNTIELGAHSVKQWITESNASRNAMNQAFQKHMESRANTFASLVQAKIQAKVSQKQHEREKETDTHRNELKCLEIFWANICSYIFKLLEAKKFDKAQEEIERILRDWDAVY